LRRRLLLASPLLVALALGAPAAAAPQGDAATGEPSEEDLATARERFKEGVALEAKGDWAAARALFEQVAKTRTSPQVLFHLALCDENIGKLIAARRGYERALEAAKEAGDAAKGVTETATAQLEGLRARIPILKVVVDGGLRAGDEITVDGVPVDLSAGDVPLDPGQHQVALVRGGTEVAGKSVQASEGERTSVRLRPDAGGEATPPPPPTTPPTDEGGGGSRWPALVVGGVGLAALVAGGVTFGVSRAAIDEVRATCDDPEAATGCDPAFQGRADEAATLTTTAVVLGAVGGVCVATGVVLWFTLDEPAPASTPAGGTSASIDLGLAPTGVLARGRF
jgi:hypothetical protein